MVLPTIVLGLLAGLLPDLPQPWQWTVGAHEGSGGRVLFATDPVLLEIAGDPDFAPAFTEKVEADGEGNVKHDLLRSGWALCIYESDAAKTVLLTGAGFHSVFVNGDRFPGDFYRRGHLQIPIPLKKGKNHLLVRAIRGGFKLKLLPAEGAASLSPKDPVLPELREGRLIDLPAAVMVLNHAGDWLRNASLTVGGTDLFAEATAPVPPVLPYGFTKAAVRLRQLREPKPDELDEKGRATVVVTLSLGGKDVGSETFRLPVRKQTEAYSETRISDIDGSVQYHAVRPPVEVEEGKRYALYLSLHGASVRARGQARAYAAKRDAFIVAPTNRRAFGFDWQDWGRLDALEALEYALANYPIDPSRVYLTGHSMGGHGTWYLGALYPQKFAAIAPSAGWASFFTYSGGLKRDGLSRPALEPFKRTQIESDTNAWLENLARTPIYILHGEKDDNVPAKEAHDLIKALTGFHKDFEFHEEPGAGHWWGNRCVDWIPLFEFCRRHRRVEKPLTFSFRTFNPGVSAQYGWLTILQQEKPGALSTITVKANPRKGTLDITTDNVRSLRVDTTGVLENEKLVVTIDGEVLEVDGTLFQAGPGKETTPDGLPVKSPDASGPFKLAWRNGMTWVYGTAGTEEENAAILAKVRYDAGVWWYRGNGAARIVSDQEFLAGRDLAANVILYGSADTNKAFSILPDSCPIDVRRGAVRLGDKKLEGEIGAFFVYPRASGSMVGVVGATTARSMRAAQQARYFISGAAIPDWVVYDAEDTLLVGMEGVIDSGYFDNDWQLTKKED